LTGTEDSDAAWVKGVGDQGREQRQRDVGADDAAEVELLGNALPPTRSCSDRCSGRGEHRRTTRGALRGSRTRKYWLDTRASWVRSRRLDQVSLQQPGALLRSEAPISNARCQLQVQSAGKEPEITNDKPVSFPPSPLVIFGDLSLVNGFHSIWGQHFVHDEKPSEGIHQASISRLRLQVQLAQPS
jgi:hypothetical protein